MRERLVLLEDKTKDYNSFNLIFGIDYGGEDEIIRMVKRIISQRVKDIQKKNLKDFLDLPWMKDPDLIIRTGGNKRISGYLPLNSSYSELYFTDKPFPDFSIGDLEIAIKDSYSRERRFGK